MLKMAKIVNNLDDEEIFTYGWFQCPQIMLLNNSRFYDFQRIDKIKNHKESCYFLSCEENELFINEETRRVTKGFELISQSGNNQLFKIK